MKKIRYPWVWIPSLYFARRFARRLMRKLELSVLMYQQLGLGNARIIPPVGFICRGFWKTFVESFRRLLKLGREFGVLFP